MLVLSRKCNEKVVFGDDKTCCVTVLSVQGNQVKLGFDAPDTIKIFREELLENEFPPKSGGRQDA